jgi:NADP-dependent 3-hydroxy acid dehydrogenase YdfG
VPDEAIQSILNRLAALEAKVSGVKIQKEERKEQLEDTKKKFEESLKVDLSQKKTVKEEISRVQAQWDKVRELLKNSKKVRLFTALANTKAFEENDLVWRIEFLRGLTDFNRTILEEQDNKDILKKALIQVVGKEIHLKFDKIYQKINQKKRNLQEA